MEPGSRNHLFSTDSCGKDAVVRYIMKAFSDFKDTGPAGQFISCDCFCGLYLQSAADRGLRMNPG